MVSVRILSVNVGKIAEMDIDGRPGQTAIDNDPDLMRVLLTVEGRGSKWDSIGAGVLRRVRA
jgi:hypothetical protein